MNLLRTLSAKAATAAVVAALFAGLASVGHATTYYVRNGGDDTAAGTDDATAWATLARVQSCVLNPGDSVLFKKGSVWTGQSLTMSNLAGNSASYITFGSYGTDPNMPKILRQLPRDGYCMKFTDCSYVEVQGLDVGQAGIGIWFNTSTATQAGITIDSCYLHDIYGYNIYYPSTSLPGNYPMAIDITGVNGITISNCTSYNAGSLFGASGGGPNFGQDALHNNEIILNENLNVSNCTADHNVYYGMALVNAVGGTIQNCTVTNAGCFPMQNGSTGIIIGKSRDLTLSGVTVERTDKYFSMLYPGASTTSTAPDGDGVDYEIDNQNVDLDHCTIANCSQEGLMYFDNSGTVHNHCDIGYTQFTFNNLTPSQIRPEVWFSLSNSDDYGNIHDNTYSILSNDSFISTSIDSTVTVTNNTSVAGTAPTVPAGPGGFTTLYDFSSGLQGWSFVNFKYSGQHGKYWGGFAGGVFQTNDPHLVSPGNVGTNLSSNRYVLVRFRNLSPASTAQVFFSTTTDTTFSQAKSVTFDVNPYDTGDTVYLVDMSASAAWTGTLDQLRFDPNGSEWDMTDIDYIGISPGNSGLWTFDSTLQGWTAGNDLSGFAWQSGGYVGGSVTNTDPYCYSPNNLGVDIGSRKTITIRMMASAGTSAAFYFVTNADTTYNSSKVKTFTISGDNAWHTYTVDMSSVAGWTGTLKQLRLDPLNPGVTGATFSVDYISIQ